MNLDREVCATVWTSGVPELLLNALCYDIGPRPPGSVSMAAAQELLTQELQAMGATSIHREPVRLLGWKPEPTLAQMVAPRARDYQAIHNVNSGASDVTGPLVDVGIASEERLSTLGKSLEGAIVLLRGFETSGSKFTPLPLIMQRLAQYGVAGALMQSLYVEGCPAIEMASFGEVHPIPAAGITSGTGRELRQYSKQPPTVRLHTAGTPFLTECANVVADFKAPGNQIETVILSAHLDSFYLNPGAFDNLTGVLSVIETARALAPMLAGFRRNLRVILFTGEEYGFIGSKTYVEKHAHELDSLAFVLNMDSLWPETARGIAVMGSKALRDYIAEHMLTAGRDVDVRNLFCMSSDYLPFFLEGVPAARPADYFNSMPPWSHTTEDTADKVSGDWLRINAMVYAQLLGRILMDPKPLPWTRGSRSDVLASVRAADAEVELRSMKFTL